MKPIFLALLVMLIAGGAGIAWLRRPQSAEAKAPGFLEVRLAQAEELQPNLRAADPTGAIWARHYEENLPAKAARACGTERFDVIAASDFFQAVRMPVSASSRSLVQCMRSQGGGYLRFATLDRRAR